VNARFAALVVIGACTTPPPECPSGFDADDEGRCLEQAHATPTLQIFPGDVTVGDMALEDFCASWNAIGGDLVIEYQELADLHALDCLVGVGGGVRLTEVGGMTTLRLPALQVVGGTLDVQGEQELVSIELPALRRIGGGLEIAFLPSLRTLDLPALVEVDGLLQIYDTGLREFEFPALEHVGVEGGSLIAGKLIGQYECYIRANEFLQEARFPALQWVSGVLKISSNPELGVFEAPLLRRAEVGLYLSYSDMREVQFPSLEAAGFLYLDNTWLNTFSAPSLTQVGRELAVQFNPTFQAIDVPLLASVGGMVRIVQNPNWAAADIDALLAQIGAENIGGDVQMSDNGE
jgi:hypothetical protein